MIDIAEVLAAGPVMPVMVLERSADAVPLARALVSGGVRVLEVTLRTPVALDCVRAIREAVPEAVVGVGTLVSRAQIDASLAAGAVFGVSPGTTRDLLAHAQSVGLPLLPGTMTPSDIVTALDAGLTHMKFFPAAQAGGVDMLKALGGPFPGVVFCPTGGIDAASAPRYLALRNVACVGGSWLAPAELIAAGRWDEIRTRAEAAAALRKSH